MIIRSSMLATFKSCPRKFYYIYERGLQPKAKTQSPDALFGTFLHRSIEIYHKEGYKEGDKVWDEFPMEACQDDKNPHVGRILYQKYAVTPLKMICTEKEFEFKIGNHRWQGRFDGITQYNGALLVVDHKTTRHAFNQLKPNDQLIAYYLGGRIYYHDVIGILVQEFNTSSMRIERKLVQYSQAEIDEWQEDTRQLLACIATMRTRGIWPRSGKCYFFGRECAYHSLCTATQPMRERLIHTQYDVIHNPLDY